jgi:hypothetical protein
MDLQWWRPRQIHSTVRHIAGLLLTAFALTCSGIALAAPVLKIYSASGTSKICQDPPPIGPAICTSFDFDGYLSYFDPDDAVDHTLDRNWVKSLALVPEPASNWHAFENPYTGKFEHPVSIPPLKVPGVETEITSAMIAESGATIAFEMTGFDRLVVGGSAVSGNDWRVELDGSFVSDNHHFETIFGDPGALQWQLTSVVRLVSEPAPLALILALPAVWMATRRRR